MAERKLEQDLCQIYCQSAKQDQLGHNQVADKSPAGQSKVCEILQEVRACLANKTASYR